MFPLATTDSLRFLRGSDAEGWSKGSFWCPQVGMLMVGSEIPPAKVANLRWDGGASTNPS